MKVRYRYQIEDVRAGYKAFRASPRRPLTFTRKAHAIPVLFFLALFFGSLSLIILTTAYAAIYDSSAWLVLGPFLFFLFWILKTLRNKWTGNVVAADWDQNPLSNEELTIEAGPGGLKVFTPLWWTHYHWSAIADYRESNDYLIIVDSLQRGFFIPKRDFASQADITELRNLLATQIMIGG